MGRITKKDVCFFSALGILFCGAVIFNPFSTVSKFRNYFDKINNEPNAAYSNKSTSNNLTKYHSDNKYSKVDLKSEAVSLNNIIIPTYDGSNQAMHPKVLYFPNRWNGWSYWMAFTPYKNTDARYENPSIVVSQDGLNWRVPPNLINPVIPAPSDVSFGGHNSDPDLVMNGNKMELWYRYNPGTSEERPSNKVNIIYRETSTDGVNWSKPEVIFNSTIDGMKSLFLSPAVLLENGVYKLWFANGDSSIYYTESRDCNHWSIPLKINTLARGFSPWHLDVIHTNAGYEMVFCAYANGQIKKDNQSLFYSNSSDGTNWISAKQIVAPYIGTNRLDNKQIYRSSLIKVNNLYRLYYSAMNDRFKWHIFLKQGSSIASLQDVKILQPSYEKNTKIKTGKLGHA